MVTTAARNDRTKLSMITTSTIASDRLRRKSCISASSTASCISDEPAYDKRACGSSVAAATASMSRWMFRITWVEAEVVAMSITPIVPSRVT